MEDPLMVIVAVVAWLLLSVPVSVLLGFMLRDESPRFTAPDSDGPRFAGSDGSATLIKMRTPVAT
jgi:hypothetical protein